MKIAELQISKDVKAFSPKYILSKNGWTVLGSGAEGSVAENPNKNYVLKLFSAKSKYTEFVKFVQQHQDNIHLPKFGRYVRPVPGSEYSYVRMEKLNELSETTLTVRYLPEMCSMFLIFDSFGESIGAKSLEDAIVRTLGNLDWKDDEYPDWLYPDTKYRPRTHEDVAELWQMIGKRPDEQWINACQGLKDMKVNLDLHEGNFMTRGKSLIITDPFR